MAFPPGCDHSDFKGNKIWTDITFLTGNIAKVLLPDKFHQVLKAAPNHSKWVVFTSDTNPEYDGNYFGAYYGSDSLDEHITLTSRIRQMYQKDNRQFTCITVIDARTDIIGANIPDNTPLPFLTINDIIHKGILHRTVGDKRSLPIPTKPKSRVCRMITPATIFIDNRSQNIYKCEFHDEGNNNPYTSKEIIYLYGCNLDEINKPSMEWNMHIVHVNHYNWLLSQVSIDRETFLILRHSYQKDSYLGAKFYLKMRDMLDEKYVNGQHIFYKCVEPVHKLDWIWKADDVMPFIHHQHNDWMEEKKSIDYLSHKFWMNAYRTDPYMNPDMLGFYEHTLNVKLTKYIIQAKSEFFQDNFQKAAIRYWDRLPSDQKIYLT